MAGPLAVWDARTGNFHKWAHWLEASQWGKDHDLPVGDLYRIEFYLLDTPFATLFAYARDDSGHPYVDPDTHSAALAEPVTKILDELPPDHLRVYADAVAS